MQKKSERVVSFLCIGVFFVSLVASVFFYFRDGKTRKLFFFPSYDNKNLCAEVRYLPKNPIQGSEKLFVEEILLGPMTNRYKRIFPRGTELNYCFLKNDILYIGLGSEVLSGVEGMSIKESVDFLKINIVKNFTFINKIDVSIDGKSVY